MRLKTMRELALFTAGLAAAGDEGVAPGDMREMFGSEQRVAALARAGRSHGLAIVVHRARQLSRWYLAPANSDLHEVWQDRVIQDAYSELIRAHRALQPHGSTTTKCLLLSAIDLGSYLDKSPQEVIAEAQTLELPAELAEMLASLN